MGKGQRSVVVAVLSLLTVCAGADAAAPTGAGVELPGSVPAGLDRSTDLGSYPATSVLDVMVGVALHDRSELNRLAVAVNTPGSPEYRHFLPPAEALPRFAPTPAEVAAVADWVRASGLAVTEIPSDRLYVRAQGPVSAVERLTGAPIDSWRFPDGSTGYANAAPVRLPAQVAGLVSDIQGLDSRQVLRPAAVRQRGAPGSSPQVGPPSVPYTGRLIHSYAPQELWTAYQLADPLAGGYTGQGQTLAIISAYSWDTTNLRHFESTFGLPQAPVSVTWVDGTPLDDSGSRSETELDTQVSTSMAPGAGLAVYLAQQAFSVDFSDAYNAWYLSGIPDASTSWTECETLAVAAGDLATDSGILALAAVNGQTLFVASGDLGASCVVTSLGTAGLPGVPVGLPGVTYPASDPNAVGVGGTTLNTDGSSGYVQEVAWGDLEASGGGYSAKFARPAYQAAFNQVLRRGVPDISFDADPNTGFAIYDGVDPGLTTWGGTSAASPAWAGFYAVQLQYDVTHASSAAFLGPVLYAAANGRDLAGQVRVAPFLHDIVYGESYGYSALPGWDPATGLGTPRASDMLDYLVP
ncbi:MAG: S53 family peptidase [Candidatus Dormibacteria bacterium]